MTEKKKETQKKSVKSSKIKNTRKQSPKKDKDVKKKIEVDQVKKDPGDLRIVYAHAKYIQISPRKARLVIDLVRDQPAEESLTQLQFVRKKAALLIRKAIKSAVSNAVNNFEMDEKKLVIVKAFIGDAPILKRGRAGSRGRYKKILKRNSHVTIGVQEQ